MSAEKLRRAATAMRKEQDISERLGRIDAAEFKAWLAVADLLDEIAERQKPSDRWRGRSHGWTGSRLANRIADAYLGLT